MEVEQIVSDLTVVFLDMSHAGNPKGSTLEGNFYVSLYFSRC